MHLLEHVILWSCATTLPLEILANSKGYVKCPPPGRKNKNKIKPYCYVKVKDEASGKIFYNAFLPIKMFDRNANPVLSCTRENVAQLPGMCCTAKFTPVKYDTPGGRVVHRAPEASTTSQCAFL
ncbi:hypothetical protein PGTUg99_030799 [Puccinia graminis f. sp. tritici]|uniref:Uncharacterized protein n=1 Tax=Puccinia graminis f. sp. tritici TaxID=56615 RepID=A0A5B0RV22_PUCGR|nr:hypothetical protein PGTUg99_001835 [Puccinia graminis f. sp. tritici]KAA1129129.1 hypothetical protein PGTUg99_030799 [Puccinia graminis f. sp. tritici]